MNFREKREYFFRSQPFATLLCSPVVETFQRMHPLSSLEAIPVLEERSKKNAACAYPKRLAN